MQLLPFEENAILEYKEFNLPDVSYQATQASQTRWLVVAAVLLDLVQGEKLVMGGIHYSWPFL